MEPCKCPRCEDSREFERVMKYGNLYEAKTALKYWFERCIEGEEDAEYYKCIRNGSWPNAEILLAENLLRVLEKNKNAGI